MLAQSITKNSLALALFALVTGGILAGTYDATAERIAAAERAAAQAALLEIVPRSRHDNDMLVDAIVVNDQQKQALGLKTNESIHFAFNKGKPVAVIIPAVAPDGYSGDIKLIVGINMDGSVAGVRVLSHKETPGLGDQVDLRKSDWLLSFNGKSFGNPPRESWGVKKDGGAFDQFTGATITPRAVVNRVKQTLDYFTQHKTEILQSVQSREN